MNIEVLDDKGLVNLDEQEWQSLRKYSYVKKMCQETVPGYPNKHYNKPFEFYEVQGEPEKFELPWKEFKTEEKWQDLFGKTLGLPFGKYKKMDTKVIKNGAKKGNPIELGDKVKIHYNGTLVNGTEFESTHKQDRPYSFYIG